MCAFFVRLFAAQTSGKKKMSKQWPMIFDKE